MDFIVNKLKFVIWGTLFIFPKFCYSQLFIGVDSNSVFINSGTDFSYYGISLLPNSDFEISNISLDTSTKTFHQTSSSSRYLPMVYIFSKPIYFSGKIQYDFSSVNVPPGTVQTNFKMHYHNGSSISGWKFISGTVSSDKNFISDNFVNIPISEITLSDLSISLPIKWKYFSVLNQSSYALINWEAICDLDSKEFILETSKDQINWNIIAIIDANYKIEKYSFKYYNIEEGLMYYRIIHKSMTDFESISSIRSLRINKKSNDITKYEYFIHDKVLYLNSKNETYFFIISSDGKILKKGIINFGVNCVNLFSLPNGLYFFKNKYGIEKFFLK